jgi:hypothetical protein
MPQADGATSSGEPRPGPRLAASSTRCGAQYEDHGERLVDGERMTFAELADKYAKVKLVPARYVGERRSPAFGQ